MIATLGGFLLGVFFGHFFAETSSFTFSLVATIVICNVVAIALAVRANIRDAQVPAPFATDDQINALVTVADYKYGHWVAKHVRSFLDSFR
jgi:hypothetical protein